MKKLLISIFILFSFSQVKAQSDWVIIDSIIGKPIGEIEQKFNELNIEYYIVDDDEKILLVYIQKENSVRLWEFNYKDYYRPIKLDNGTTMDVCIGKDLVIEIFVRYRHSNMHDLREFFEYETPVNTDNCTYEKSNGSKLSHLKAKLPKSVVVSPIVRQR